MSLWRNHDIWLAAGLTVVILGGLKVIGSQIFEGDRLSIQEVERNDEIRRSERQAASLEEAKRRGGKKPRGPVEDDISLDHLEVLIKHPNYDIRYAAIKILLHRFSGNAYCIATLQEDHEIMEERRRQGKDNGEYNQAFGVYDLAESHGIDLPLRERTNVNSDWTTGNTENRNDILSVQGALDILNGANNERLDLQSFLRDARGVLGRFVESIEEGQGAELLAEMTSARNRSLRSGEQSPEELALSHWRRREAVVIENEDGHGSLEVIMPRESTEREMLDGEQQGW